MTARPHVEVILSMSVDGRISDTARSPARIGSDQDLSHLYRRLMSADAVLFGSMTLRAVGHGMLIRDPDILAERQGGRPREQPIQIVVSRSCTFPASLPFFREESADRWIITQCPDREAVSGFDRLIYAATPDGQLDWPTALTAIRELGIQRLAVLGGGEVVSGLLREYLIDNFLITVCPLLIGGAGAPTLVDGPPRNIADAVGLTLVSSEQIGSELYLEYQVVKLFADAEICSADVMVVSVSRWRNCDLEFHGSASFGVGSACQTMRECCRGAAVYSAGRRRCQPFSELGRMASRVRGHVSHPASRERRQESRWPAVDH